jgi:hypothetical protein
MSDSARVYVATESFVADVDGIPQMVYRGQTRVREGHALVLRNPSFFKLVDEDVQYEIETASAEPGEQRRATTSSSGKGGKN